MPGTGALLSILVFVVVILLILKQPTFRVPFTLKSVKIDYGMAPVVGVIILLLTFSADEKSILRGIVGTETIKPYSILILFMSLAYICISLDLTGFFAYLALLATNAAGRSGKKLFLYFFFLSSFLTLFTSNDIVILTMTPIVCYFAKNTKTDPTPFLIAQFFAANIWSIALYIGNPTNIIVAQAYSLSFSEYSRWMVLPTVSAGISCLLLLWLIFRKRIPDEVNAPKMDPDSALVSKGGVIFGVTVLLSCLLMLSASSWLGVPIWVIPFSFSIVMLVRDVLAYHVLVRRGRNVDLPLPTLGMAVRRMPWKIVPFIIGLFIMVENLSSHGWVDIFASNLSRISSDLLPAVFAMGFLSSLASNLMNNQPMTILFTKMLQSPSFVVHPLAKKGSMFALILGSNFGANFTLIGALAGIMWSKILLDKGANITFKEFSTYGFLVTPLVVAAACSVLAIELMIWP